jgi:uncharacterized protein DUF3644
MRGLPRQVKAALEKARDSALLAVEVYNKPAVKFKSGGYITLMVIAWTSLFHAKYGNSVPLEMDIGGIVRVVDVIDCVEGTRQNGSRRETLAGYWQIHVA